MQPGQSEGPFPWNGGGRQWVPMGGSGYRWAAVGIGEWQGVPVGSSGKQWVMVADCVGGWGGRNLDLLG